MHDAVDGGILLEPLLAVERGTNITYSSWSPLITSEWRVVRVAGQNNSGMSNFLAAVSVLLADNARVARERILLFTSSYADETRQLARLKLSLGHAAWLSRPRVVTEALRSAPAVDRRAVEGFDVSFHVPVRQLPPIAALLQRAGRCNRAHGRIDALSTDSRAFNSASHVDDAEVSDLVQAARQSELRRLAKVERHLLLALRRMIQGARNQPPAKQSAPSRGESVFRLPLTGARTPTAPPVAA